MADPGSWMPHIVAIVSIVCGAGGTYLANAQKNEMEVALAAQKNQMEISLAVQKNEFDIRLKATEREWSIYDKRCETMAGAAKSLGSSYYRAVKAGDVSERKQLSADIWSAAFLLNEENRVKFFKMYTSISSEKMNIYDMEASLAPIILQSLVLQASECRLQQKS